MILFYCGSIYAFLLNLQLNITAAVKLHSIITTNFHLSRFCKKIIIYIYILLLLVITIWNPKYSSGMVDPSVLHRIDLGYFRCSVLNYFSSYSDTQSQVTLP